MKKLMIMVLACFFAVSTTVNAQLINPGDEPMLISEPEISDEEFEAILMEMEELEAMQPDPEDYMKIYMSNYDAAMAWAFENNILTGDGETGDLRPYDCVKRAEFLKMLYNVLKVDTTDAKGELFTDTPSDQWYINFVRKAREKGTIEGYSDGSFRPGTCVNRAEAIKIAFLEFPEINPVATAIDYDDVPETEWYYKYVSYALANNLVGTRHIYYLKVYNPGVAMTRDEFAEMLYRLKTVQDNNLDSYDDYYAPNNIEPVEVKDYDLEPEEFFEYGTSLLMTVDTHNQNQIDQLDSFLAMTPA